jgi:hypothetical protein
MNQLLPLILLLSFFHLGGVMALEVRAYDPARHDRFVNFPSNLASNPDFYLKDEDWSGFGWSEADTRRHLTLISPKHFVGAAHFRPRVGQQVQFQNRDGVIKSYPIAERHPILNDQSPALASDLFIGELSEPIPEEDLISVVPIYNLTSEANYVGTEIVISGQRSRSAQATISRIADFGGESGSGIRETRGLTFVYTDPGVGDDDGYVVGGDSGSPSAVRTEEGLALVGTHSAVLETSRFLRTTYTCYDAFVPHYLDRIDAVLEEDGYHAKRLNTTIPDLGLSLVESADPAISSQGVSYTLTVSNSAKGDLAHNLVLSLNCDAGANFSSASGAGWVVENGGSTLRALRGGLASNAGSNLEVILNLPDQPTGAVTFSASLTVDGGSELVVSERTEVAQSYQSWALGLVEDGPADDPDGDGLSNQLEYALGRNGGLAEATEVLAMEQAGNQLQLTYATQPFAEVLGISVILEATSDLLNWENVESVSAQSTIGGFQTSEHVSVRPLLEREFFRLRVGAVGEPTF